MSTPALGSTPEEAVQVLRALRERIPDFTQMDTPETRQDLADYYSEIIRLDENIGWMIAQLEKRNLRENTLIIFLSDNGAPFPREKGTAYDSGVRTPLVFRWPGVVPAGVRHGGLLSVIDLAPTFLDLAGIETPPDMQGESIAAGLERPGLLQQPVHERGLAVIDMRDDGDVAKLFDGGHI